MAVTVFHWIDGVRAEISDDDAYRTLALILPIGLVHP